MILTTRGTMEEATLDKRDGAEENDHERTTWVEYRLPGTDEIIHRSVHVTLKQNITAGSAVGGF